MPTNRDLFQNSREKTARILSDRYDINVYYEGDKCCTDGRTIYLPALPENVEKEEGGEEFLEAMDGLVDHETGHVIFTEFGVIAAAKDHYTRFWVNVLEDARIEERMQELWRGSARNFRNAEKWATKKLHKAWDELSEFSKLSKAAFLYAKGGEELVAILPDPEGLLKKIDPLIPALMIATEAPDTHHILALAEWVVGKVGRSGDVDIDLPPEHKERFKEAREEMAEMLEEAEEERKSAEEGKKSAEEGEEGEEGSTGPGEETLADSGEGASSEESSEEKASPSADGEVCSGLDAPEDELKEAEKVMDALREEISREAASMKGVRRGTKEDYMIYSTVDDVIQVVPPGDRSVIAEDLRDVRRASGTLTRRLKSVLLARARTHNEYDKTWGKLNNKAIPRLLTSGYARVFKQKSFGEKLNCRISLVIDQSGSMFGRKIEEARRCAVLLGEFCHQTGIPFEVFGFTTGPALNADRKFSEATAKDKKRYHRWGDLHVDIFKEFFEDWKAVNHRLSRVEASVHNYDGEAVKLATQRLLLARQDPNERLVMFVLSDGLPEQQIQQHNDNHCRYLKRMVGEATARGVECIGIGICASHVREYYPSHIVIHDPSALQGAQIEKLKEVLQDGRRSAKRRKRG